MEKEALQRELERERERRRRRAQEQLERQLASEVERRVAPGKRQMITAARGALDGRLGNLRLGGARLLDATPAPGKRTLTMGVAETIGRAGRRPDWDAVIQGATVARGLGPARGAAVRARGLAGEARGRVAEARGRVAELRDHRRGVDDVAAELRDHRRGVDDVAAELRDRRDAAGELVADLRDPRRGPGEALRRGRRLLRRRDHRGAENRGREREGDRRRDRDRDREPGAGGPEHPPRPHTTVALPPELVRGGEQIDAAIANIGERMDGITSDLGGRVEAELARFRAALGGVAGGVGATAARGPDVAPAGLELLTPDAQSAVDQAVQEAIEVGRAAAATAAAPVAGAVAAARDLVRAPGEAGAAPATGEAGAARPLDGKPGPGTVAGGPNQQKAADPAKAKADAEKKKKPDKGPKKLE
ncbi:MAG TPA: hypothetical protein VKZ63_04580, partial [Kofleriaceae bacterium]|nr:hypothetical protein [Kofleriaceae bacterium]